MKEIKLTLGKVAIVDDGDYEALNQYKWSASKVHDNLFYARRTYKENGIQKNVSMHRELLGITDLNILVDHKDRNGLNNTRNNLRTANNSQNMANQSHRTDGTSIYRGVSWCKYGKRWKAQMYFNGKHYGLGLFYNELVAAQAYNKAALKYFGEFASLNTFPENADFTEINWKEEMNKCDMLRITEDEAAYLLKLVMGDKNTGDNSRKTIILKLKTLENVRLLGGKRQRGCRKR